MLTKEEKQVLWTERAQAKLLCKEFYGKLKEVEQELETIKDLYSHWKHEYESIDYQLAEYEKLQKVPPPGHHRSGTKKDIAINLTDDQLLQIAAELGIDLEEETE